MLLAVVDHVSREMRCEGFSYSSSFLFPCADRVNGKLNILISKEEMCLTGVGGRKGEKRQKQTSIGEEISAILRETTTTATMKAQITRQTLRRK